MTVSDGPITVSTLLIPNAFSVIKYYEVGPRKPVSRRPAGNPLYAIAHCYGDGYRTTTLASRLTRVISSTPGKKKRSYRALSRAFGSIT